MRAASARGREAARRQLGRPRRAAPPSRSQREGGGGVAGRAPRPGPGRRPRGRRRRRGRPERWTRCAASVISMPLVAVDLAPGRRRRRWWSRWGRGSARGCPSPATGAAGRGRASRGRRSRCWRAWTPGRRWPGRWRRRRAGRPRRTAIAAIREAFSACSPVTSTVRSPTVTVQSPLGLLAHQRVGRLEHGDADRDDGRHHRQTDDERRDPALHDLQCPGPGQMDRCPEPGTSVSWRAAPR